MIVNEGGGGKSTKDATAVAGDILTGKTAYGASGKMTGTMPNHGAVSGSVNAGGSYTIPAGYHNGAGKVTGNSLSGQTSATASAADILSGETAWVNGTKITGSMTNRGAVTQSLNAGGSYTIPAGYHNGTGRVSANSLASQTSATAVAADIKSGKTAWVNGVKITGSGNVPEKTTFGFLCHGLYGSVRVHTDLAPDGEYFLGDGDSSAHTFECTVGSIVAVYCRDERDVPGSRQTGFEMLSRCIESGYSGIIVFQCTEAEGIIDLPS